MAVSYLSTQDVALTPYVVPFSLELMSKVNQYKQTLFYKNAENLKSELYKIENTPIYNKEQDDRRNSAYKSVVSQINEAGAIDYSDLGIVGQVQGLGQQIYKDPYIMKGIANSQKIQKYMTYAEKMQTDPKLSKVYDPTIVAYETNKFINGYINGGLDASYNGPSAPTASVGNIPQMLMANVMKANPDIYTQTDAKGTHYYSTTDNKTLSPSRVRALLNSQIDGKMAYQMNAHAWYNLDQLKGGNYSKDDAITQYTGKIEGQLQFSKDSLAAVKSQTPVGETNTLNHTKDILKYETEITDLSTKLKSAKIDMGNLYDDSKESAMYAVYKTDMIDNLTYGITYAQQKEVWRANLGQAQQDRIFLKGIEHGVVLSPNPTTGGYDAIPILGIDGAPVKWGSGRGDGDKDAKNEDGRPPTSAPFVGTTYDEPTEEDKLNHDKFIARIKSKDEEANSVLSAMAEKIFISAGMSKEVLKTGTTTDPNKQLTSRYSDLLNRVKAFGDPSKLEESDFRQIAYNTQSYFGKDEESKTMRENILNLSENERRSLEQVGIGSDPYTYKDRDGKIYGMSQKGYDVFKSIVAVFDQTTTGAVPKSELANAGYGYKEVQAMVNEFNSRKAENMLNRKQLNTIYEGLGVDAGDIGIYNEMKSFISKHGITSRGTSGLPQSYAATDPVSGRSVMIPYDIKKLDVYNNVTEKIASPKAVELFGQLDDRLNRFLVYIPPFSKEELKEYLPTKIADNIRSKTTKDSKTPISNLNTDSIVPKTLSKNPRTDKWELVVRYGLKGGDDTNLESAPIEITVEEARKFGGRELPDMILENYVRFENRSLPQYSISGNQTTPMSIKYEVVNGGTSRSGLDMECSIDFVVGVDNFKKEKIINIKGPLPAHTESANAAKWFADALIANYKGTSLEEFAEYLNRSKQ